MIEWADLTSWIPPEWSAAITSSLVVSLAGIVAGTYYKAKVEKAIQHNFDTKLEALRAGFRMDEEALRAELQAKGEQIAALRGGALSGLASRKAAIDQRRLEALDRVWAAATNKAQYKSAARMSASINMDVALDAAAKQDAEGAKLREFATVIWNAAGLENLKAYDSAHSERPFLPPLVWALYSALSQVLSHPVAQLAAMRTGAGGKALIDPKPMLDLVKSALPHQTAFIDQFGVGGLAYLIDELEEALLREIQRALHNPNVDQASLEQAAAILKAAEKLAKTSREAIEPPPAIAG